MLINIDEIKINDRIRKDYGNLEELAEDIKENGLINPPVVTPDTYDLIAGERRIRAMKLLGYQQIEVRPMAVKDAEHQLNLEISENESRKEFSKAERIEYARRLERIEAARAKERHGGHTNSIKENFPGLNTGQARDIVAAKMGIGSGRQYEKEKYIVDHQTDLAEEEFSDWDAGKLSTNKVYQKLKQENENYKLLLSMIPELEGLVDTGIVTKDTALAIMKELNPEEQKELLDSIPTDKKYTQKQMDEEINKYKERIIELESQNFAKKEVVEVDRPETLKELTDLRAQLNTKQQEAQRLASMVLEKEKYLNQVMKGSTSYQLISHCSEITLKMLNFVKEMNSYDRMPEVFNEIPDATRREYKRCVQIVKDWADRILEAIETEDQYYDVEGE